MNYIDLINHFWRTDEGAQFTGWEAKLYFYLIKTANSLGWVNVFWHSDGRVSANVGMSVNTMKTSRNRLKQAGLIDFVSGGKGHGDKTRYQILLPKVFVKEEGEALKEMTRYQNLRTKLTPEPASETEEEADTTASHQELGPKLPPKLIPKLTPKPAPVNKQNETKQKKINTPLFTDAGELSEKTTTDDKTPGFVSAQRQHAAGYANESFNKEALKADLLASEICRMAAKNAEIPAEEYPLAVENFTETKFGLGKNKSWRDITDAREHFMYWIPYFKSSIAKKDGKRNTEKASRSGQTRSGETQSGETQPESTQSRSRKSGRQIVEQPADDDSVLEQGADGVVRRVSGKGVQTFAG